MKRLGLLACDSLWEPLRTDFGDYAEMFAALLEAAGARFDLVVYPVYRQTLPPAVDACDAWLVSGSRAGVYESLPWIAPLLDFVRATHRAGHPQAGICFGHQVLAHALGGRTEKAPYGWSIGNIATTLLARPAWLGATPARLDLHMAHQDQVVRLPPGALHLATTAHCHYAGFTLDDCVLGLQAHPEFTTDFMCAMTTDRSFEVADAIRDAAMNTYTRPAASATVAQWLVRFLRLDGEVS